MVVLNNPAVRPKVLGFQSVKLWWVDASWFLVFQADIFPERQGSSTVVKWHEVPKHPTECWGVAWHAWTILAAVPRIHIAAAAPMHFWTVKNAPQLHCETFRVIYDKTTKTWKTIKDMPKTHITVRYVCSSTCFETFKGKEGTTLKRNVCLPRLCSSRSLPRSEGLVPLLGPERQVHWDKGVSSENKCRKLQHMCHM